MNVYALILIDDILSFAWKFEGDDIQLIIHFNSRRESFPFVEVGRPLSTTSSINRRLCAMYETERRDQETLE